MQKSYKNFKFYVPMMVLSTVPYGLIYYLVVSLLTWITHHSRQGIVLMIDCY